MAEPTEDEKLAQLDDLISQGVKSIFTGGERTEFQDTGNLIKARNHAARVTGKRRAARATRMRLSCRLGS